MIRKEEILGIDRSSNEQVIRIILIWEPEKETVADFLKECTLLFPGEDRCIMRNCVHVNRRKKLPDVIQQKPKNKYDEMFADDMKKKGKNR
jgi:hypothetical protein